MHEYLVLVSFHISETSTIIQMRTWFIWLETLEILVHSQLILKVWWSKGANLMELKSRAKKRPLARGTPSKGPCPETHLLSLVPSPNSTLIELLH